MNKDYKGSIWKHGIWYRSESKKMGDKGFGIR